MFNKALAQCGVQLPEHWHYIDTWPLAKSIPGYEAGVPAAPEPPGGSPSSFQYPSKTEPKARDHRLASWNLFFGVESYGVQHRALPDARHNFEVLEGMLRLLNLPSWQSLMLLTSEDFGPDEKQFTSKSIGKLFKSMKVWF